CYPISSYFLHPATPRYLTSFPTRRSSDLLYGGDCRPLPAPQKLEDRNIRILPYPRQGDSRCHCANKPPRPQNEPATSPPAAPGSSRLAPSTLRTWRPPKATGRRPRPRRRPPARPPWPDATHCRCWHWQLAAPPCSASGC